MINIIKPQDKIFYKFPIALKAFSYFYGGKINEENN